MLHSRLEFSAAWASIGLQKYAGRVLSDAKRRPTTDTDERDYLWNHFVFNAEQGLKAFNFFVVFSVFANGGVFAAVDKDAHGAVFVLIGGFVVVLSAVFWMIDKRSQWLRLAVPGVKEYEKQFSANSRLFARDAALVRQLPDHSIFATNADRGGILRYTFAFRILFGLQICLASARSFMA